MAQKILVIEDEDGIIHLLNLYLKDAGYTIIVAKDGADGLALHAREHPDLLILDIMLPGLDGFEICCRIRVWSNTPILILTARSDEEDRINGLEMGADDYLVKPFSPRELVSRVRAILRRVGNGDSGTLENLPSAATAEDKHSVLHFPGLTIDLLARRVEVKGREVALTPTEFDLLALLARSPDRVFTREVLINQIWGYDYLGDGHTIDVHISTLRKKIDLDPQHRYIKAIARKASAAAARATAIAQGTPLAVLRAIAQAQTKARANQTRNSRTAALRSVLQLVNPSDRPFDFEKFQQAIVGALTSKHLPADKEFGRDSPLGSTQPFSVRPIFVGSRVVGALLMTTRSNGVPPFVTTVGMAVLIASIVIIVLAVLAAILVSRPITVPLAKLTTATRLLTGGDYSVQVPTKAPGELGELARNFNEMAAQLKQDVEELQRQEVWRRELIMNITHDLATPLTAIAGLGEALIDGVNHSREDYEATGRVIVRETLRLHRLVRDLHVMAKLEAEAIQPKKKTIRLAALVDEVLAVLAAEFERCSVEPVSSIPYDLTPVQADADLLTRVFSNLCSNSLRHTPPGGYVIIEALEHAGWLVISVTDTGEGIPAEALSRVFERFYRADSSRQSSTGGSGLGLAIVRAIIKAHGGAVWVENVPGAGARISFTIPLCVSDQPSLHDTPTLPLIKRPVDVSQKQKREPSLNGL